MGVSYDGLDGVFEAVVKYRVKSGSLKYPEATLLAMARNTDGTEMSVTSAIAAFAANPMPTLAPVPEPSAVLLSLFFPFGTHLRGRRR